MKKVKQIKGAKSLNYTKQKAIKGGNWFCTAEWDCPTGFRCMGGICCPYND